MSRLEEEIAALLEKGACQEVPFSSPGFYGRLFVVPKLTGGWRPVLDLSRLNDFLVAPKFRMETPTSLREALRPGDWAASIDLKDAYFHIPIAARDRKWLRFRWRDKAFQFCALPFGISLAPWLFTKVTGELGRAARSRGIRLRMYLDDWLVLSTSEEGCREHLAVVLELAESLGFFVNLAKSELVPAQVFSYLGMTFDTLRWEVKPAAHRLDRLRSRLSALLAAREASAHDLQALLGTMESLAMLLPLGRLHKRPLQRALRARWSQSQPLSTMLPLAGWFEEAVSQWRNEVWLQSALPIVSSAPQVDLFTDASKAGWGAHAEHLVAAGSWSAQESELHINVLELEAVCRSVVQFVSFLKGKSVRLMSDNTTVACYVNKQGGARSVDLSLKAEGLLLWCLSHDIHLTARYVPGKLNVLADSLSRSHMILPTEWTLSREVLEPVWTTWFRPLVDLFATRFNHRLPVYVSPVPDPAAWAIDALSVPWSGLQAYAFPPFPLMSKVLRKVRWERPQLILVAPWWPSQPWFPDLLDLAGGRPPIQLVVGPRALVQPRSGIPHASPQVLNLHAWML